MARDHVSLHASRQSFVRGFRNIVLCFLLSIFQADVSPSIISKVVALKQEHKARNPAISIAEMMNTEEIEIECRQGNERMDGLFFQALIIK
jgi:hypothetical protein